MKTRKIENQINWNNRLRGTMEILGGGEIYTIDRFKKSPRYEQVKMLNDMRIIVDAPKRSVVWNLASSILGNDFEDSLLNVYYYCSTMVKLQSVGA